MRLSDRALPTIASYASPPNRALHRNTFTKTNRIPHNTEVSRCSSLSEVHSRKPVSNLGDLGILGTDYVKILDSIQQHEVLQM